MSASAMGPLAGDDMTYGMRFDEGGWPDYPACPTCGRNPGLETPPNDDECHPVWRPGIGECCCSCDCPSGATWDMPGDWVGNARDDRVYMCDGCATDYMGMVA